ncbi:MAG: VanZ family protein [Lachnospiraceae bacterium]|nr:VanZ family protein [Lachnospiraceae bacterium]
MERTILELINACWTGLMILPYAVAISIFGMLCMKILYKKISWKLFIKTVMCNVYFIGVLNVTGITYHFHTMHEIMAGNYALPNLILFRYLTTWDMLLNIIMMVPLGFILMEAKRIHMLQAAMIGILITVTIECMQFMQGRCFDINDIFFNEIGTIIGIVIHGMYRDVRKPER